jgi:rubrerythrin
MHKKFKFYRSLCKRVEREVKMLFLNLINQFLALDNGV